MEILTPFQIEVLKRFARTPLNKTFFLTGGTALSAFYLQHRLSEDLDFFTEEEGQVPHVIPILQRIAVDLQVRIEVRRQFASYLEIFLHSNKDEIIKCDFARDSPYRHEKTIQVPALGIFTDNVVDIACNKLSALFDRTATKDFVDVYFLDKETLRFPEMLTKAKMKHVGMDDYWLAISLRKVMDLGALPKMVKPLDVEAMHDFFLTKARELMEQKG